MPDGTSKQVGELYMYMLTGELSDEERDTVHIPIKFSEQTYPNTINFPTCNLNNKT